MGVKTTLLGNYRDISHLEQRAPGKGPGWNSTLSALQVCTLVYWLYRGGSAREWLGKYTWGAFWIQTLAPAYTGCVTLGKLLNFSESQFFHL